MQDLIPTTTCQECGRLAERDTRHQCRTERREVLSAVNASVKDDLGLLPDLIVN